MKKSRLIVGIGIIIIVITCLVLYFISKKDINYIDYYSIETRISKIKDTKIADSPAIGWVRVQGTNIDTPMVIRTDEVEESVGYNYLWLSEYYFENENRKVIYGHNIRNVSSYPEVGNNEHIKFEQLVSFAYYDFAKENLYIQFSDGNDEALYKIYAVTFNNENKAFVNTLEEAEQIVADIKNEHNGNLELNIGINEYYTVNVDDANKIDKTTNIQLAKETVENSVDEYIIKESKTVNGVYLATTPVSGRITSRFGAVERVRSGAHTGLDIAAPAGTKILAVADGVVTHASRMGSYGNLVKINHGHGVETYYAHCSKILVKEGQEVKAGDNIALVGSTGNSTGNHLHLEVRINGKPVNPQKYLYNN